jgi:hypothetical protein
MVLQIRYFQIYLTIIKGDISLGIYKMLCVRETPPEIGSEYYI